MSLIDRATVERLFGRAKLRLPTSSVPTITVKTVTTQEHERLIAVRRCGLGSYL